MILPPPLEFSLINFPFDEFVDAVCGLLPTARARTWSPVSNNLTPAGSVSAGEYIKRGEPWTNRVPG